MTASAQSTPKRKPPSSAGAVDILVVGAGVFGLWVAKRGVEAGLTVAVVDPKGPGGGASGGLLGALTAHAPNSWNAKKQFQFDALRSLPEEIAVLEAETGRSTGYRRAGRIMPIKNKAYRAQIEARSIEARTRWMTNETGFVYAARDDGVASDWLAEDEAPFGYVWDSLAARIAPRDYISALWTWLSTRARVIVDVGYEGWDGGARLSDGSRIAADAAVLAAGFETFPMLAALLGRETGGGVKGQSVLLRLGGGHDDKPLIYEDGVYVVPHSDGRVAVGGTNEKMWETPDHPDPSNDAFLRRARALCPALVGAEIEAWWAGARPRCRKRDPMIGRLPVSEPLYVATGGYKISFGIAHRVASALVQEIVGDDQKTALPESFTTALHLGN